MSTLFETVRSAGDRTWLEIDLDALYENTAQICALLPKQHRLIATVKANAYGHGDYRIALELQKIGIDFFGVSNLEEAIGLRSCGITGEILILGYTAAQNAKLLAEWARQGDEVALRVYRISGEMLGKSLAILIDILNPERIVIGSIFARSQELIWPAAKEVIERETLARSREVCEVVPAGLGEKIGDYAALAVATLGGK